MVLGGVGVSIGVFRCEIDVFVGIMPRFSGYHGARVPLGPIWAHIMGPCSKLRGPICNIALLSCCMGPDYGRIWAHSCCVCNICILQATLELIGVGLSFSNANSFLGPPNFTLDCIFYCV